MSRSIVCALVLALTGAVAFGTPFWIAYEADGAFPEEEGWTRITYGGGAERWFEDGALVLDGSASIYIVDDYWMQRALDPGPGEYFRMEWRLRVDEVQGFSDPLVAVSSSGHGIVILGYTTQAIYSVDEGIWVPFVSGVFHEYSFLSDDMLTYELRIDGQLAHTGQFVGPYPQSGVTWGDGTSGASSLSVWDYVRFGVVPEPSTSLLLVLAGLAALARTGGARGSGSVGSPGRLRSAG